MNHITSSYLLVLFKVYLLTDAYIFLLGSTIVVPEEVFNLLYSLTINSVCCTDEEQNLDSTNIGNSIINKKKKNFFTLKSIPQLTQPFDIQTFV